MSNPFHLAIPAGDLNTATKFYTEVLGCKLGNGEDGKWIDVDFWGNELTLHKTDMKLPNERHDVDMGNVAVPHFGVHLDPKVFDKIWWPKHIPNIGIPIFNRFLSKLNLSFSYTFKGPPDKINPFIFCFLINFLLIFL